MLFVPKERRLLVATFPQNAIAGIETGLEAEIALKAYPGRIFKAKVSQVMPIILEGQFLNSGRAQSATPGSSSGDIPVVYEYGEDVEDLDLPTGSQASIAVYTHHLHAITLVRKMILRIKSKPSPKPFGACGRGVRPNGERDCFSLHSRRLTNCSDRRPFRQTGSLRIGDGRVLIYPLRGCWGRMVMSYFASVGERSRRASIGFICCFVSRTPSA